MQFKPTLPESSPTAQKYEPPAYIPPPETSTTLPFNPNKNQPKAEENLEEAVSRYFDNPKIEDFIWEY